MDTKICSRCKNTVSCSLFGKDKNSKDRLKSACKFCRKEEARIYRESNEEWILQKYHKNKGRYKNQRRGYAISRADHFKEYKHNWYEANKERLVKDFLNRLRTDLEFKLKHNLRTRLNTAIRKNQKAGSAVRDLGCSISFLKGFLEAQFQDGMTWNNLSKNGWHIDHIRPLASFDLTDRNQFLQACHFQNLQPLWAVDNLRKGDKVAGIAPRT